MSDLVYLAHHGIKGQRWGVRNYQNSDGSLTPEGRKRYGVASVLNGGVFDYRKTLSSRAKKVAKFGSALVKAKAEHYGKQAKNMYNTMTSPGGYASYKRMKASKAARALDDMNSRNVYKYNIKKLDAKINLGKQALYRLQKEIISRRIDTFGSYKTDDEIIAIGMAACKAAEKVAELMSWHERD